MAAKGVDFPGSTPGFDTKARTDTGMPTSKMGGKNGPINSPVANHPEGKSTSPVPKGSVPKKNIVDSPVQSN